MQRMAKFSQDIAIYSKLHVTVMAMDMLQQVGFPPDYLTSLSMYNVFQREVKPKSFDDLEIVKVADRRLAAERRVIVLSFGL